MVKEQFAGQDELSHKNFNSFNVTVMVQGHYHSVHSLKQRKHAVSRLGTGTGPCNVMDVMVIQDGNLSMLA